jgi:hypothetical protein
MQPTGASLAWTSDEPAIIRWRQLVEAGDFRAADASLQSAASTQAVDEAREMMRRLRWEFGQSETDVLARLRADIPDATLDDLRRWTRDGHFTYRVIDGQPAYFRREPRNLFIFCAEARQRRDKAKGIDPATQPAMNERQLGQRKHIQDILAASEKSDAEALLPIRTTMDYALTVKPNQAGAKPGSVLRCWLPFPQVYKVQKNVKLLSCSPAAKLVAPEGTPQRSVYCEHTIDDPAQPVEFRLKVQYDTAALYPRISREQAQHGTDPSLRVYLDERPPHVVFTDRVKQAVKEIGGDRGDNPYDVAKRAFDWVDANIPWCAEVEYAVYHNLVEKGLKFRRSDCGIQSLVFQTLCRASGVPARWQSGWVPDPWGGNLHDWSEIYLAPWGWIPVDASYGKKKGTGDARVDDFYFGHLDHYRMITCLDYGSPLVPPKPSLRSEPLDFQRGEVELDGRNLYFDAWDYDATFTHVAL